MMLTVFKSRLY